MADIVKILSIRNITHNVLKIETTKPVGFKFTPGQATDLSLAKRGWESRLKPFTITSLPDNDFLQFIIKTYPEKSGVTNEFLNLKPHDELIVHDVFGTLIYVEEGLFIAGGAGVTPFIAILRHLESLGRIGENKLIFANKRSNDIILENELEYLLGRNFINILSEEETTKYLYGYITDKLLKQYLSSTTKNIYVCGPPKMIRSVETNLAALHIDLSVIIKERA